MIIEKVSKGTCSVCKSKASKALDGVLYCSQCADTRLLRQIKRCIEAVEHAVVTIKVLPAQSLKLMRKEERGCGND